MGNWASERPLALTSLALDARRQANATGWSRRRFLRRAIGLGIAQRHGARLVAKSKSMVTEEVDLNQALADAGIECIETDLGEWIVQLGSFGEEANARRLAQRASTFGYQADVSSVRSNNRTLYRVRVGPATSRAHADATASALKAHGLESRVVAAR